MDGDAKGFSVIKAGFSTTCLSYRLVAVVAVTMDFSLRYFSASEVVRTKMDVILDDL